MASLYTHQERAVRATHVDGVNVVVATGTASGKTESFLYPILFELYRQHLAGELEEPGARAMILYPMNALANDQRERLGAICGSLQDAGCPISSRHSGNISARRRKTPGIDGETPPRARRTACPGSSSFATRCERSPPHILLTNYSMLEYLLIRPDDSPLFDAGRGVHWQFVVLDEAHQYRGAKGMEMGMLIRRLKQRLRDGGRRGPFRCIATSATITSGQGGEDKRAVAEFATELVRRTLLDALHSVRRIASKPTATDLPGATTHFFARSKAPSSCIGKVPMPWCSIERAKAARARPANRSRSPSVASAASTTMWAASTEGG